MDTFAEEIFEAERADLQVAGDYEEFQIRVGLLKERLTLPKYHEISDLELLRVFEEVAADKDCTHKKQRKKRKSVYRQKRRVRGIRRNDLLATFEGKLV